MAKKYWLTRLTNYFILVALIILPFQFLWLRLLEVRGLTGKGLFLLTDWYELVYYLIFFLSIIALFTRRIRLTFKSADYIAIAIIVWAVISFTWSHHSVADHIIGIRYSLLPVFAYVLGRLCSLRIKDLEVLFARIALIVLLVTAFQLISWLIFPWLSSLIGIGKIDYAWGLPRLYAPLNGPLQLAGYCLALLPLLWYSKNKSRYWLIGGLIAVILATLTRSAWLGLLLIILLEVINALQKKQSKWPIFAVIISFICGLLFTARNLLFAGRSSDEHRIALFRASEQFIQSSWLEKLIGFGSGSAGPAVFVLGKGIIPENWYLQTLHEYGLIGLGLFAILFVLLIINAYLMQYRAIAYSMIGILSMALFLHPLSDSPAATFLIFVLAGMLIEENGGNAQQV